MSINEIIKAIVGDEPNSLYIEFNDHWSVYAKPGDHEYTGWVSEDEKQIALAANSVWHVQYYPSTPVGFYECDASSLEAALDHLLTLVEEDRETL